MTKSWMNILMESLRRLSLILELARRMSPLYNMDSRYSYIKRELFDSKCRI